MPKLFKKNINRKWAVLATVVLGIFLKIKTAKALAPLLVGGIAAAGAVAAWFFGEQIASLTLFTIIGGVASFLSWVIGHIAVVITDILFAIAPYNNFIKEEVVTIGWPIIRDLCNMFFILVLLIIAFATILRIENYNIKKTLPKLLIMAILINFSKTICGLAIDFAQVIMLTFVNAFGQAGRGNLYQAFGLQKLYTWQNLVNSTKETSIDKNMGFAVAGSILLGLMLLIIACVVILIYTAILLYRIIMLWILIILSPLAFLAMAIPAGAKYASQWTSEFTKYVIIGPVMAFFLWLALSISATTIPIKEIAIDVDKKTGAITLSENLGTGSEASQPGNIKQFMVTTLFLLASLMMAQQAGVAGGGMAGNFVGKVKSWSSTGLWGATKMGLDYANRKQATSRYGIDLNPFRQVARIKAGLERLKSRDLTTMERIAGARLEKGGVTGAIGGFTAMGWADQHLRGFLGWKGMQSAFAGGKKTVEKLRGEEKENKFLAGHVYASDQDYYNALAGKSVDLDLAGQEGDTNKADSLKKEINKMEDYFQDDEKRKMIIAQGGEKAEDKAENYNKIANEKAAVAAKYTVVDYEGIKAMRAAANEEAGKITSTNEDELVAQFETAVAHNNVPLATALAQAIAKVGGGNALLRKYGYQAKGGLTKKEVEDLERENTPEARKIISEKKGLNDFMRDVFMKKMGMDEQKTLALQSDLGGIGQNIGHSYLAKTVKINDVGKLEQANEADRESVLLNENMKIEPEKVIRNFNRLFYGTENRDNPDDFDWSPSGIAYAANYVDIIAKEIIGNRFNKSAARSMAQDKVLNKLLSKLDLIGKDRIGPANWNLEQFKNYLKNYAKGASGVMAQKLLREDKNGQTKSTT